MGFRSWFASRFTRHRLRIPLAMIEATCARHGIEAWHPYAASERFRLSHVTEACDWIADHLPRSARIHELGCGIGLNLFWLAQQGFTQLAGSDLLPAHVQAGSEIATECGMVIVFTVDDGIIPRGIAVTSTDALLALNWLYLPESFDIEAWFHRCAAVLVPGGHLVFDLIDGTFGQHPMRAWRTADWNAPVEHRRPSEYLRIHDQADVARAAAAAGFSLVSVRVADAPPCKAVYVLRRTS